MPRFANHAMLSDTQARRLVEQVQGLQTLEDVIRWGLRQPIERTILEVLVQDEYCHDVVMQWELDFHLVFDTTWLGGVNLVSVWDHRPSPEEMLDMRVLSGWKPTPTATVDGDKILGHAACLVTEL